MTLPKKGFRTIVVNETKYAYKVIGDYHIDFIIGLWGENGQVLTGSFHYNSNQVAFFNNNGKIEGMSLYQKVKVTPKTIRQLIEYGLKKGWKPKENKKSFHLGVVDKETELNVKQPIQFPKLKEGQVALIHALLQTGHVLKIDKQLYLGVGEIHLVFETLEEAKDYARKTVKENAEIECCIMSKKDTPLFYVGTQEERDYTSESGNVKRP